MIKLKTRKLEPVLKYLVITGIWLIRKRVVELPMIQVKMTVKLLRPELKKLTGISVKSNNGLFSQKRFRHNLTPISAF